MKNIDNITMIENITLISINDSPADFKVVAQIFEMLSNAGIDVDMISQNPPQGKTSNLSFTVNDEDLGKEYVEDLIHNDPCFIGTKWHNLSDFETLYLKLNKKFGYDFVEAPF